MKGVLISGVGEEEASVWGSVWVLFQKRAEMELWNSLDLEDR